MTVRDTARILIATLLLSSAFIATARANPNDIPGSGKLYITADNLQQRYVPLDPVTLADQADGGAIDFGEVYPTWALSADGSPIVRIDYKGPGTISVRDARTGVERIRFEPAINAVGPQLSADGSRLVVQIPQSGSPSGVSKPVWYTFDTTTGTLLSSVDGDGKGISPYGFYVGLIDADARRLYRPIVADTAAGVGPWPLWIVADDLTTGAELGRIELPDVLAGSWWADTIDQAPVNGVLTPAVALSPDGRHLAVVHTDGEALTLIDTERLTVERTVAVSRPRGLLDRLFGLLPLAPQSAEAKFLSGVVLQAVFSPDSHRLYLFGRQGEVGEDNQPLERGLGIKVIDVEEGTIQAEALSDLELSDVLPSPDGRTLYVGGPETPPIMAQGTPPYLLYRLDASTLETLAQRQFGGYPLLLLLTEPPSAQATGSVS